MTPRDGRFDWRDLTILTPWGAIEHVRRFARGERTEHGTAIDEALIARLAPVILAAGRLYFRLEGRGFEHVPAAGPALLVGNHNGGVLPLDTLFTIASVVERLGPSRAPRPLVHDFAAADSTIGKYVAALGGVRADPANAARLLERGELVLVYPGSEFDNFRPFARRARVELGGRTGFVRLALRARVPIVPIVSAGTHEQLVILDRGERIARALRMERWLRLRSFPIALALPWGLTTALLPYLPLPAQTRIDVGAPILLEGDPDDPSAIRRGYEQVRDRMQAIATAQHANRRFLFGAPLTR